MTSINLDQVDEISLQYISRIPISDRPVVQSSDEAASILRTNWNAQLALWEEFKILLLDNAHHVLGISTLSKGGMTSTIVDIRLAFATALNAKASSLIMAHNHPSGNLKPSRADICLTEKFFEAGKILDIKILDHVILAPQDGYYSFRDEANILI